MSVRNFPSVVASAMLAGAALPEGCGLTVVTVKNPELDDLHPVEIRTLDPSVITDEMKEILELPDTILVGEHASEFGMCGTLTDPDGSINGNRTPVYYSGASVGEIFAVMNKIGLKTCWSVCGTGSHSSPYGGIVMLRFSDRSYCDSDINARPDEDLVYELNSRATTHRFTITGTFMDLFLSRDDASFTNSAKTGDVYRLPSGKKYYAEISPENVLDPRGVVLQSESEKRGRVLPRYGKMCDVILTRGFLGGSARMLNIGTYLNVAKTLVRVYRDTPDSVYVVETFHPSAFKARTMAFAVHPDVAMTHADPMLLGDDLSFFARNGFVRSETLDDWSTVTSKDVSFYREDTHMVPLLREYGLMRVALEIMNVDPSQLFKM